MELPSLQDLVSNNDEDCDDTVVRFVIVSDNAIRPAYSITEHSPPVVRKISRPGQQRPVRHHNKRRANQRCRHQHKQCLDQQESVKETLALLSSLSLLPEDRRWSSVQRNDNQAKPQLSPLSVTSSLSMDMALAPPLPRDSLRLSWGPSSSTCLHPRKNLAPIKPTRRGSAS